MPLRPWPSTVALLLMAASAVTASPPTTTEALQRIAPLALADPPAFIAAVGRFQEAPSAPPGARDLLNLRLAQSLALQGRYDDARRAIEPMASSEPNPTLRSEARATLVAVLAADGQFLAAQQTLESLLADPELVADPALRQRIDLLAAVVYNLLLQPEPAQRRAEAVLTAAPEGIERCVALVQWLDAQTAIHSSTPPTSRFAEAHSSCQADRSGHLRGQLALIEARWLVGQGRFDEAVAPLRQQIPVAESAGAPALTAEMLGQLAEALLGAGALDEAAKAAEASLAISAIKPAGRARLLAYRVRYAVAQAREDDARALEALESLSDAEKTYGESVRQLQEAYQAGKKEASDRRQAMVLLETHNARLQLEAQRDARWTSALRLVLVPIVLALLALLVGVWRSRARQRQLRHALQVDGLTGVFTRPHFTENATARLDTAAARTTPMALVLIDLDHFSRVNAQHGHLAGDKLLGEVGRVFLGLESEGRRFGRLGGEEFAALLDHASLDEGLAFAERCRAAVEALSVDDPESDGRPMRVTASFGVVSTAAAGYRLRDLLARADEALYRAKNSGRNRVAAAVMPPRAEASTA